MAERASRHVLRGQQAWGPAAVTQCKSWGRGGLYICPRAQLTWGPSPAPRARGPCSHSVVSLPLSPAGPSLGTPTPTSGAATPQGVPHVLPGAGLCQCPFCPLPSPAPRVPFPLSFLSLLNQSCSWQGPPGLWGAPQHPQSSAHFWASSVSTLCLCLDTCPPRSGGLLPPCAPRALPPAPLLTVPKAAVLSCVTTLITSIPRGPQACPLPENRDPCLLCSPVLKASAWPLRVAHKCPIILWGQGTPSASAWGQWRLWGPRCTRPSGEHS